MRVINLITSCYQVSDIEKLKDAGAGSVILGMPFFSVRSTSHFTKEELKEAVALCHQLNMNAYVLVNRFFVEEELAQLHEVMLFLKSLCVDGIYFTDMGVFYEAQELQMEHLMIYNPDTILTNSCDVNAYLSLGMKMCTLAKEITLEEILCIAKQVQGEMEIIVHGRLNMMHSKRNLLTNYMQFLNKDKSVRDRYDLYLMEENREEHMPIVEDEHGTHVFTGFTLCSLEEVEDLVQSGIHHLRIEGMWSTITQLCEVVMDYRKVIENPERGRAMFQKYEKKYPDQNITKGFLYKKTGLLK